jgi:hypothetical protein
MPGDVRALAKSVFAISKLTYLRSQKLAIREKIPADLS